MQNNSVLERLVKNNGARAEGLVEIIGLELWGRAGENIFLICVSLIGILRVGIAKHHAVEVVSKSQPLKLNSERALTPAVCWQIRLADSVVKWLLFD